MPFTTPGAYGIESVASDSPEVLTCGVCGTSWIQDITPAGRCPWEYKHADMDLSDMDDDGTEDNARNPSGISTMSEAIAAFDGSIDDAFGDFDVVNVTFRSSVILRTDPVAYRGAFLEWADMQQIDTDELESDAELPS